jgi:hypothetical protein
MAKKNAFEAVTDLNQIKINEKTITNEIKEVNEDQLSCTSLSSMSSIGEYKRDPVKIYALNKVFNILVDNMKMEWRSALYKLYMKNRFLALRKVT